MSLAGRQIHHRVGAPERRPAQLVHFLGDRRADGGVADVRVDLHQEVAADDHRLELGVVDVGRNDGAAARDFGPHELGRQPLAHRDELHLRRDVAAARVVQLRDAPGPARARRCTARPPRPVVDVAAPRNPRLTQRRQARSNRRTRGPLVSYTRSGGSPPRQRDLAHRHPHARRAVDVAPCANRETRCRNRRRSAAE